MCVCSVTQSCPILFCFFFPFIFISWRLITLQYCSRFCHTLTWISHGVTCILCDPHRLASLITQLVKNPPTMQETLVQFLGWEDPLEKGKATHSSILAWRIPWIQSMGSQRVRHDWATFTFTSIDCSPSGSSVHGISKVRTLEWVAISSSRGSPWPRNLACVSCAYFTGRQILYHCTTWETPESESWSTSRRNNTGED